MKQVTMVEFEFTKAEVEAALIKVVKLAAPAGVKTWRSKLTPAGGVVFYGILEEKEQPSA